MATKTTYKPTYATELFVDVYPSFDSFSVDYATIMGNLSPVEIVKSDSVKTIYYLLYSRYGNNPIANLDLNQWKYKLFTTIFMYGGKWEKQLDIQNTLKNLTEDELLMGPKQIYNHAFNPSSTPSTTTLKELEYINDQNTANNKKSKLEAYNILWSMLHANATEDFLTKFRPLFTTFVAPLKNVIYMTEDEEDE